MVRGLREKYPKSGRHCEENVGNRVKEAARSEGRAGKGQNAGRWLV